MSLLKNYSIKEDKCDSLEKNLEKKKWMKCRR